jgi:hypothetical protein
MLQPNLQRSHTGVHRTVSPRRVAQAEQRGLLHAEIDDSLRSRAGELRVRLRPFPPYTSGDGSMPPPVERMASFPATPGVAQDERHTAEPVARTGSLRSVSTLLSFFPILLWVAAVVYAMSEVLLGVPAATSTFGGLLAGSTLASGVVIAIESRRKKGPPELGAETRAQRVEDPDAVKGRRS